MSNDIVLQCTQVKKTYFDGKLEVPVLHGVDLAITRGEQVAIVGASGVGKSTLLHLLGGLDQATAGSVSVDGQVLSECSQGKLSRLRNQKLGFVYQMHHLLPEFTVLENVSLPLLLRPMTVNQAQQQAMVLLEKVGLGHRVQHKIGEVSGGERQRTALARALVTTPLCLLADEPTGNLDQQTAQQVYQTLLDINRELGTALIIVTHDMTLANKMDRILQLDQGILQSI